MSHVPIPHNRLHEAYRGMRMIRTFEERLLEEMSTGDIPGNTHLYVGQEACAVGVCLNLDDDDYISSTHRGHGHAIAKGVDVDDMMAELFGRVTGTCGGKGGSKHIADFHKGMLGANGIVGGGAPIAVGAALSAKVRGTKQVSIAFLGDGAMNEGVVAESLNLAKIWSLPVIFVIEDNGYGEATANSYASAGSFTRRAMGYDIPAHEVDGSSIFNVFAKAAEAVELARSGGGPILLHVHVPRFSGHYSGDPDNYRSTEEKAEMRANRDCLVDFRQRVAPAHLETRELEAIDAEVGAAVDRAVAAARQAEFPKLSSLNTDVYVSYS